MSQSCPVTNCRIRRISAEIELGSVLSSCRVMLFRVDITHNGIVTTTRFNETSLRCLCKVLK